MLRLAWRNLIHDRTRLGISAGGVALAVVLILVMAGVFAGSEEHAVIYIKNQPAPLWMMQDGVSNMHMSSSLLAPDTLEKVKAVSGVKDAVGLLYANSGVDVNGELIYSYVFAVDNGVDFGGPWEMAKGRSDLEPDEVIIDQNLAARYGADLGSTVNILGSDLKIAGLSKDSFGIATSISFVNKDWLAGVMGISPSSASYILIQPDSGLESDLLAADLQIKVPGNNVMSQADFASSDQEMIRQMGTDIIKAINSVSYVVGLLVIAITIYTATLDRTREYGMLKAIGADFGALVRVVFAQAYFSSALGFLAGVGLSYGIASLVSFLLPEMLIIIRPIEVIRQIPILMGVTAVSGLLPLGRIARLDPMVVFKE